MYNEHNSFCFNKVIFGNNKMMVLCKDDLIYVGIFDALSKNCYCKCLILHFYSAFVNYLSSYKKSVNDANNNFCYKIFERFYLKYLSLNINEVINKIVFSSDIIIPNITFENVYVLDLSNDKFVFNLRKMENVKSKKISKNIKKRIINFSHELQNDYIKENRFKLLNDFNELNFYFVKYELTSSYPRYTYIIKFIPVLKGITIIHEYSQKKLSRQNQDKGALSVAERPNNECKVENSENEKIKPKETNTNYTTNNNNIKKYKECDILYAQHFKNDPTYEFKYTEPKKLKDVEVFIIDFLLHCDTEEAKNEFCLTDYKCKYFNSDINEAIFSILNIQIKNKETNIERMITNISSYLAKMNIDKSNEDSNSNSNNNQDTSTMNSFSFINHQNLNISKGKILKIINSTGYTKINSSRNSVLSSDQTLNLSKVERCTNLYKPIDSEWTRISKINERPTTPNSYIVSSDKNSNIIQILDAEENYTTIVKREKKPIVPIDKSYTKKMSQIETARTLESNNTNWNQRLIKMKNPSQKLILLEENIDDSTILNRQNHIEVNNDSQDDCSSNNKFLLKDIHIKKYK